MTADDLAFVEQLERAGIGSEPYVAVEMGRRGIGIELKASYYQQMVANLKAQAAQSDMFGTAA